MPKYRKKPVVIEAFQMLENRLADHSKWPPWLLKAWSRGPGENGIWIDTDVPFQEGYEAPALVCGTLEGVHRITKNDWIIKEVQGELYPCKPDIFEATYELAEE